MRTLVKNLTHIGYQVSQLDRSLAFYTRLGFSLKERINKTSANGQIQVAFIELAGVTLELYQIPEFTDFDIPRCGIDHIALQVTELAEVQRTLDKLGYQIDDGPVHEKHSTYSVDFLLIRGPDGERLEFDEFNFDHE